MLFKLPDRLMDEYEEGVDGSAGDVESVDQPDIQENPWDGPLGALQERLAATEGRFGEQLAPLSSQLQQMQKMLASRTSVQVPDDKIAAIEARFTKYDPSFEGVGDLLRELITSSVQSTPLDAATLGPVVGPMLQQLQHQQDSAWLGDVMEQVSFDHNGLVNDADPFKPQTALQKAFLQFYNTLSAAEQKAVYERNQDGSVPRPREFGKVMMRFDRQWRKNRQESNESAGASSARLAGAQQARSVGRSNSGGGSLRTESDGFASVFK